MTPEQLVYRSIGVPDSLRAESRAAAASHRLAVAAGLDVAQDPNVSHQSQVRLADAARVVERAVEVITAGEIDGVIGGFGHRDDDWYVSRLIRTLDLDVYENGQACAVTMLDLVRAFVEQHPFEDEQGRPFT